MPASTEQKVDFLLKKIGYTASKSGIAEDSSLSGTKKAPFAEAIPSPLATPSSNIWADSTLIPATPPGSDTAYVKGYRTATALRMTADSSVSGSRAFIAYTTYNNTSTPILGDWIDTQFGADYIVKVYKGDPNSSGVQLSAAGAGSNDTWFFDYASGVLNFNGTQIPSGVTDTNIYIVAYRYIGAKGARPAAGIATFKDLYVTGLSTFVGVGTFNSHLYVGGNLEVKGTTAFNGGTITLGDAANDNVVFGADVDSNIIPDDDDTYDLGSTGQQWRNLYLDGLADLDFVNVSAASTFGGLVDINAGVQANTVKVEDLTDNRVVIAGTGGELEDDANLTFNGVKLAVGVELDVDGQTTLDHVNVSGVSTFAGAIDANGHVDIDGHLDVDNVNIAGVTTTAGLVDINAGGRANTFIVEDLTDNRVVIAGSGGELEDDANLTFNGVKLAVGVELDVDGHTELDNVNVSGVTTFVGNIDSNSPVVDIDGHLEVDNVHVAGVTTFTGAIDANSSIDVAGTSTLNDDVTFTGAAANVVWDKSDNRLEFADNASIGIGNDDDLELSHDGTTSLIRDKRGSGSSLKIGADSLTLQNKDGNEPYLVATDNGSVDIYYDFSKKFSTTGIGVSIHNGVGNTATIAGPSNLIIDPGVVGDDTGSVRIKGNLYVDGAQFTVASGTIELEDHVVGIATTAGTNALLDGGGIGIGSANIRKTLLWNNASAALKSSEHLDIATGKVYKINGTSVLSNTTLGTTVVDSSLKNLGTLIDLDVAGITTFNGNIDANANLDVDGQTDLDVLNVSEAATFSSSIDVDGQTELDHLNVAGVSTFAGIARFNGDIDANGHVDIDGHTELDNVNISGVTTTGGLVDINAGGRANTFKVEDLTDNRVVIAGSGGELEDDANLTFNGVKLAVGVELDVDGQTTLDHVITAGVTTTGGLLDINAGGQANTFKVEDLTDNRVVIAGSGGELEDDANLTFNGVKLAVGVELDVDGQTTLDHVNVAGVSTLTTLRIGNTNNITSILDEDNLGSDSATALATQQSIKAYVDSQVTAQDLDFQADTGGALSIDLDSETLSVVGTSYEVETAGSGNQIQIGLPNNVVVSSGLTATNLSVTGVSTLTTLRIGNTNNITHIRDEDNMASNSATSLATQQSIKAYVDSQVTAQDLDFQADTGGALSIDLDSEVLSIVGTSYEIETAGSGNQVTIGLPNNVVVSSGLTATNLSVTGVSTFAGAIDANGHVDIDGHLEVDNVNVAGVSTLTTLRIGNTNNITSILDEDNMASNSATALATQQSIKAYVDTQITAEDLDFAGDSGTGAVDLDSQSLTIAGTSNEIETSASGQTLTIGLPNNVTIGNNLTVTAILDVDGHTELDNLNVAGVSTFGGTLKIPAVAGTNNSAWQNVLHQTSAGAIDGGSGLQYHPANDQLSVNGLTITSGTVYSNGGTSLKLADANHSSTHYIDISNKIDMAGNVTVTSGLTALNANITGVSTFAGIARFNGDIDANGHVDIDGHTELDNVNVAGVSTLTTLRIGNTNNINSILDEDNMASNSATALATQQSIKAYVDSSVTAQDLDVSDGSNAIDIDLDSETLTIAGTSNEIETSASGTTVTIGLPNDVTIGNNLNVTAKLDVDGHTELDNVNVSGIVTTTNLTVGVGGTTITTQNTTSRVGINSTSPAYMLDVGGIINSSTDVKINGVSVVTQEVALNDAVAMAIALG